MPVSVKVLDDRFSTDEIMSATELQETAIARLQERITKHHKLLLTHYSRPVGVLLDMESFAGLVERVRDLEEMVEELEASRLVRNRLRESESDSEWFGQEEFAESIKRLILGTESQGPGKE